MKTSLKIEGMHCKSCELLLEKEISKVKGVKSCEVSHKTGEAIIESVNSPDIKALQSVVEKCGYNIVLEHSVEKKNVHKKNTAKDYVEIALIAIGVIALAMVFGKLDVLKYFPQANGEMTILLALFLGVAASLSTCLVLIGGIVMSFGSLYPGKTAPHFYFHIGRVAGFFLLGGVLGLIGQSINYSLSFTGILTLIVAVVMFYMGLYMLNIVPSPTKMGLHMPKSLSKKVYGLVDKKHRFMPLIIGVLTFFLPCGFTQSMQVAAMGSGSFLTGGLIMGVFALGTTPVLLSIGIGSGFAKKEGIGFFSKLVGIIVIVFSIYSINSGLVLAGFNANIDVWNQPTENSSAVIENDVQVVRMDIDGVFKPSVFEIKKDVPVRFEINPVSVSGCTNEIVIPSLGIRQKMGNSVEVIEFTPEKSGTIPFSCWMGMVTGKFIVTD